jgi:hypothetical protein
MTFHVLLISSRYLIHFLKKYVSVPTGNRIPAVQHRASPFTELSRLR